MKLQLVQARCWLRTQPSRPCLESQCEFKATLLGAQVVQVYPKLMAGEVLIQDAASLAAPGEELTYWAMQARVHSVRQTLLGAPPRACSQAQRCFATSQPCVDAAAADARRASARRNENARGIYELLLHLGMSVA